ncbi:MAG: hypothetical protein HRU29_08305 [Rhizobiales bacterium]|nr:DUF6460 domain-containing protein [Hyphomicrobiales bacterium]NRB14388.1 hypothetical protein [Hyphomicrobiales bacterium]
MRELLGKQPTKMVIKLILMSLFVGFMLKILNITPVGLFEWAVETIGHVINISFNSAEKIIGYVVTGAMVVLPIWLFKRITERNREDKIKNAFKDKSNN